VNRVDLAIVLIFLQLCVDSIKLFMKDQEMVIYEGIQLVGWKKTGAGY